jgi:dTDP-glucose 4,6-dehydratase
VIDIDFLGYCSNKNLPFDSHPNYTHIKEDICNITHLSTCDVLVNFAAETHVDNSINDTSPFIHSNILGVHNLIEICRGKQEYERPLFFQISTDEVYGDRQDGEFKETDMLKPSNPYAATKIGAEALVLSYHRTYGIDYIITRSSNNYGNRQYEEKLIPRFITNLINGNMCQIHGQGTSRRNFIHTYDVSSAVDIILQKGEIMVVYGNNSDIKNLFRLKE